MRSLGNNRSFRHFPIFDVLMDFQAVDEGVGDFFAARKVSKEHVVPDTTTRRQNEINKEKSEEPT